MVVKEQRGRSQSRGPKKGTKTSTEAPREDLLQVQEMLKKKGGSGVDGANSSGKQMNQAGIVEKVVEELGDVLSVYPGRGKERFLDAWLLDSECKCHVCPRNECFNIYEPFEEGTVLMSNYATCKIVGIYSICMKMLDRRVQTLKDMRYVSDMRKNLLLLGALKANGYKFSNIDGVLKVTKGSMTVLKGKRMKNLYKMIGSYSRATCTT